MAAVRLEMTRFLGRGLREIEVTTVSDLAVRLGHDAGPMSRPGHDSTQGTPIPVWYSFEVSVMWRFDGLPAEVRQTKLELTRTRGWEAILKDLRLPSELVQRGGGGL